MAETEDNTSQRNAVMKPNGSNYTCFVECLDGNTVQFEIDKQVKASELYDKVFEHLNIQDKEYFGLHFVDNENVHMWLDKNKNMKHQLKGSTFNFKLRIKFYEAEPNRLHDDYTRFLMYLQLREDIVEGKIVCNENTYALLGSYTLQAELGDYDAQHQSGLDDYEFSPNQTRSLFNKVTELHKEHRGQTPAQAELNFLEVAKKIKFYGQDIHNAQDVDGPIKIGACAAGIYIYRNDKQEFLYRWQTISEILYNRRRFTVKLKKNIDLEGMKSTYVFYFQSAKKCKQCYKSCVEHHAFFRLSEPEMPRKKYDSLRFGSSFRYSDRTLYMLRQNGNKEVKRGNFKRSPSKKRPKAAPSVESVRKKNDVIHDEKSALIHNVDGKPSEKDEKSSLTPSVQYEEIEVDENNPNDEYFDPEEWTVQEKTLPDGTRKRYRCRVIVVQITARPEEKNKANYEKEEKTGFENGKEKEKEKVVEEEKEDMQREVQVIPIEIHEVSKEVQSESEAPVCIVVEGIEDEPASHLTAGSDKPKNVLTNSSLNLNMDNLLLEMNRLSQSFLDDEYCYVDDEDTFSETDNTAEASSHKKAPDVSKPTDVDNKESKTLDVVDENQWHELSAEDEKKLSDDLNATIESIFHIEEDDYRSSPKYSDLSFNNESEFTLASETSQFEMPPDYVNTKAVPWVPTNSTKIKVADEESFVEAVNTSRVKQPFRCKEPTELEVSTTTTVVTVGPVSNRFEFTFTSDYDNAGDKEYPYVDLGEVLYVNVEENDIRSASLLRQQKEIEKEKVEKMISDETKQLNASLTTQDVAETEMRNDSPTSMYSEVVYTVTDVSTVEQGGLGFVRAVKAKHEQIASTEERSRRESCEIKGHVPTRSVSFNVKECVIPTKTPPAVAAKPTIIVQASSELPNEEVTYEISQAADDSVPNICETIMSVQNLPDVTTQTVTFDSDEKHFTIIRSTSDDLSNEASQVVHIFGLSDITEDGVTDVSINENRNVTVIMDQSSFSNSCEPQEETGETFTAHRELDDKNTDDIDTEETSESEI